MIVQSPLITISTVSGPLAVQNFELIHFKNLILTQYLMEELTIMLTVKKLSVVELQKSFHHKENLSQILFILKKHYLTALLKKKT